MRILITGGHGFIGGRLGTYLSEQGFEVTLGSRKNLYPPEWSGTAKTIRTVWESESSLKEICADVDVVIHAAGMNAKDCMANPKLALEFNGLATARLVDAAVNSRVKLFIYLSTAHVYSNPLSGHIDENTPTKNNHPYATSHLAGEKAVLDLANTDLIRSIVLRVSNAFGYPTHPEVDCWDLLINNLCKQAVVSKKIRLNSSGKNVINFITMTNLCKVINFFILRSIEADFPKIINLGSNESNSVYEMAQLVQNRCSKAAGFTPKIEISNQLVIQEFEHLDFNSLYKSMFRQLQDNNQSEEIDMLLNKCKLWFTEANA